MRRNREEKEKTRKRKEDEEESPEEVWGVTSVDDDDSTSGDKMKELGWEPAKSVRERIKDVTNWTLDNKRWIKL